MEPFEEGSVYIKRGTEVGYLSQMPDFNQGFTLLDELKTIYQELIDIEERLRQLEKKSVKPVLPGEQASLERLMEEYSDLQHQFEIRGGYQYESKIRQMAYGMDSVKRNCKKGGL